MSRSHDRLLKLLNSIHAPARNGALQEVKALPPEELLELLEEAVHCQEANHGKRKVIVKGIGVIACAIIFICLMARSHDSSLTFTIFAVALILSGLAEGIAEGITAPLLSKLSPALHGLCSVLENTDDLRYVVPALRLYDQLEGRDPSREEIAAVLLRLLPLVRASHATLWTKEEKEAFLLPLKFFNTNVALILATLKALGQVGGAESIRRIKELIAGKQHGGLFAIQGVTDEIREAARECLGYLEASYEQTQQMQTLLRPSAASAISPDTLLRPADDRGAIIAYDELLRPVDEGEPKQITVQTAHTTPDNRSEVQIIRPAACEE